MRGLSFSSSRRSRGSADLKSTPTSPHLSSTHSSSSSLRLLKKLSASLRRRDSSNRPADLPRIPSDDLTAHTSLPPIPTKLAGKARALTFAVGEPAERSIPFFETASPAPTPVGSGSPLAPVAVVRGKPEWQRRAPAEDAGSPVSDATAKSAERALSSATSEDELPAEPALKTLPSIPVPVPTPAPLKEANAKVPPRMTREHALSFSATDRPRRATAARAKSVSVPEKAARQVERKKIIRRRNGQRWMVPHMENKDMPRLFTPPAGTAFERISARRDRTEARALVSACTYLESEVMRMRSLLAGEEGKCCCGKKLTKGGNKGCQCAMRSFLEQSSFRMKGVLRILEDRYDSIEQVYIKSEEYAVAMGRFFEVSPQVINKLAAGHHEAANQQRDVKHKSLR